MGSTNHIPLGVVKVIYFLLKIKDTCQTDGVLIAFQLLMMISSGLIL